MTWILSLLEIMCDYSLWSGVPCFVEIFIVSVSCNLLREQTVLDPLKSFLILLYLCWGVKLRVQKNFWELVYSVVSEVTSSCSSLPLLRYRIIIPHNRFFWVFSVMGEYLTDIFTELPLYDPNSFLPSAKGCFREMFPLWEEKRCLY